MAWANLNLLIYTLTVVLYFAVPFYLLTRGWPLRAGVAMAVISLIPGYYYFNVAEPDSLGLMILLLLTLPITSLLIVWGLIAAMVRDFGRSRKART
jgi:hypothetical protein